MRFYWNLFWATRPRVQIGGTGVEDSGFSGHGHNGHGRDRPRKVINQIQYFIYEKISFWWSGIESLIGIFIFENVVDFWKVVRGRAGRFQFVNQTYQLEPSSSWRKLLNNSKTTTQNHLRRYSSFARTEQQYNALLEKKTIILTLVHK